MNGPAITEIDQDTFWTLIDQARQQPEEPEKWLADPDSLADGPDYRIDKRAGTLVLAGGEVYRKLTGGDAIWVFGSHAQLALREELAHGSEYVVVEYCNDRQALQAIRRRIQAQMSGLDVSAAKVQGRVRVLDRLLAKFRRAA